jgi:Sulfotransferase family
MGIKSKLKFDRKKSLTVESAIDIISQRYPDVKSLCLSQPVFIMSAGWRSGSTLLQRLLISSDQIIIWGEPYGHSGMINYLASSLKAITSDYPNDSWFIDQTLARDQPISSLSNQWIANLYPKIDYLIAVHVSFFINHFEAPAINHGILRWGIKEVRLTIDHAIYLNWLFPLAKFIFLYRNPYNCYASYKGFYWYNQYPDDPVCTPQRFGRHWKELVEGFIDGAHKVNSMILKYEDFYDENVDFDELETFLNLKLNKRVLANVLYSTKKNCLSEDEIRILSGIVNPIASYLGYSYLG